MNLDNLRFHGQSHMYTRAYQKKFNLRAFFNRLGIWIFCGEIRNIEVNFAIKQTRILYLLLRFLQKSHCHVAFFDWTIWNCSYINVVYRFSDVLTFVPNLQISTFRHTFFFRVLSFPSFAFLFLFFPFAGHLFSFILVGKVLGNDREIERSRNYFWKKYS